MNKNQSKIIVDITRSLTFSLLTTSTTVLMAFCKALKISCMVLHMCVCIGDYDGTHPHHLVLLTGSVAGRFRSLIEYPILEFSEPSPSSLYHVFLSPLPNSFTLLYFSSMGHSAVIGWIGWAYGRRPCQGCEVSRWLMHSKHMLGKDNGRVGVPLCGSKCVVGKLI